MARHGLSSGRLDAPVLGRAPPGMLRRGFNAAPRAFGAKGSSLVLHDDLGCGKRKRWREAGGRVRWGGRGDREDDTPQLHFYLETLGKVFLAEPAFLHYTGERLVLLMSPPPFPGDEVTGFN